MDKNGWAVGDRYEGEGVQGEVAEIVRENDHEQWLLIDTDEQYQDEQRIVMVARPEQPEPVEPLGMTA